MHGQSPRGIHDPDIMDVFTLCKNNPSSSCPFMESNHGCFSMNRVLALSELQLIMLVGIVLVV